MMLSVALGGCGKDGVQARGEEDPGPAPPTVAPNPALAREHFTKGRRLIFGSRVKMNYETFDYEVLEEGLTELETAATLSPRDAEIAYWAGRGWRLRHDDEKALAHFERAVALRPDHADTHRAIGSIRFAAGDVAGARAEFERALALGSEDYGLFLEYGALRERENDLEGAREFYLRAIAADALQSLPHFRLGTLLFRLGEEEEAEREMARFDQLEKAQRKLEAAFNVLRNKQQDPQAMLGVAGGYAAAEDYAEALVWLDRVLAVQPDEPSAHLYRGMALRGLGRNDEACVHFEEAARLSPTSPEPWRELARLHCGRKDSVAGIAAAQRGFDLAPADPVSHCCLGEAHAVARDLPAARACFEAALELESDHVPSLVGLGNTLASLGQRDHAIARYEAALRVEPRHYEARRALQTLREDRP